MKIGIDYRFAIKSTRGIGYYIRELVQALMKLDHENTYLLYVDQAVSQTLPPNFYWRVLPFANLIISEQLLLPFYAKKDRIDLFWYPSNSGPIWLSRSIHLLLTIHDLIFMQKVGNTSGYFRHRFGEYYRKWSLVWGISRVDELMAVSQFTADEIRTRFNREAQVIYNHVLPITVADSEEILVRYHLKSKTYCYTISGIAPHKNIQTLLKLFSTVLRNELLVITGIPNRAHQRALLNGTCCPNIIFTDFISEGEKQALLKNARLFLFLSLYEGFGIPLLEAMQQHVPIIASKQGAITEVLGGNGVLVDPLALNEIESAIKQALEEPQDMRGYPVQLAKFTHWEESAQNFLAIIEKYKKKYG
ncbi:glycosyltransferase [Olivibacter ginsenosidimutans]|uniref:Glycosyltransferase n=1 Tax=Olivibacter ginsenosidimutans TaxID=1176537 RepID=A0ABP9ASP6_9SPHI